MTSTALFSRLGTPIGELLLFGDGETLTAIDLPGRHRATTGAFEDDRAFEPARAQLAEYFAGSRTAFTLPLSRAGGGDFDRLVWTQVCQIPYGSSASYGQVAAAIGHADAFRAVGASNGRNPLPIVVPCHRVIGGDGKLVGYGGGLPAKRRLLALESGGVQQELL
ncbi:MAG: methylated-DNA--[protein]-cysteine S-methyltransferase [Thermoleophilaceae bacterium]